MKIFVKKRYASLHHKTKFIELKGAKLLGFYKKYPLSMYLIEHNGYKECYFECDVKIEEGE